LTARGRVLLVEDHLGEVVRLAQSLRHRGYGVEVAPDLNGALQALGRRDWDSVLVGPALDGGDPVAGLRRLSTSTEVPVLLLARAPSHEVLDAATRAGAFMVLGAPVDLHALDLALDRAAEHSALRREVERLEQAVRGAGRFDEVLGSSPAMQGLYDVLERAAGSDAPVLLTGESGTGKEVVARALHRRGRRAAGPFVAVNLAAVPDGLLESELFGHARGAFTDARTARRGLFVQASGGTLFLDEVGELSLALQPKLLRALQERTVRPVGSDEEVPFDARIIAATNRDPEAMVERGAMRQDLFYRLAVIQVELPPLRNRGNDIALLAEHFLARAASRTGKSIRGLSPAAARMLLRYRWPGNVRELENVIERAVALTHNTELGPEDLPGRIAQPRPEPNHGRPPPRAAPSAGLVPLAEVEERHIRQVLEAVGGNKAQAARILGLDRKTLYRKLQRYGLIGG
jgi:DNA-binding NtrC family response regulator